MKKLLALLLAAAMLLSFAACGEKEPDPVTDESTTLADETLDANATEAPSADATEPVSGETEPASVESSTGEAASEEESSAAEETSAAIAAAPTAKADIIAVYNNAVNSAYNAKAGFSKTRSTDNEKMDAGIALMAFKDLVYKFMGVGAENKYTETVTKGKWDTDTRRYYIRKSTLSEADVTNATCTEKNGQYTISLSVKGGSSKGSKDSKFTNAPIDKCGICVGNEDKGYYDHKTGEVIYDALDDVYAGATIDEKYSNAKVTAVVDGATGKLVKLNVEFDIDVAIDISIGKGTATATTHIAYFNFKY